MPEVQAYVDAGFLVAMPNYRGSTGYGRAWRDALTGDPGFTDVDDVTAGLRDLLRRPDVDGDRAVIAGWSWGGYITLMELGRDPDLWRAGIAGVPVGDYVGAYEQEAPALQAMDRALFGRHARREARPLSSRQPDHLRRQRARARPVRDRRQRFSLPARPGARLRGPGRRGGCAARGLPVHDGPRVARPRMRRSGRSERSWTSWPAPGARAPAAVARRSPGRASRSRPCGTPRCWRRARSCPGRRIPRRWPGSCSWIAIMIVCSRSSTVSRVHPRRSEFCDISRPLTATPPAFAALPGP